MPRWSCFLPIRFFTELIILYRFYCPSYFNFVLKNSSDPNIGTTKLPIVLKNIDSLPKWPKYTITDQEYLDMDDLSKMVVRKELREKYCEFHKNPNRFLTVTSLKDRSDRPGPTSSCHVVQLNTFSVALLIFYTFQVIFQF